MHLHEHHAHTEERGGDVKALALALGLISAFMVAELVGGIVADSLALLADAGHMLSDAGSLGLALFASWIARRPPTPDRSFGYRRAEILAALANGVALVAISIWIFVEAAHRLADPPEPGGLVILAIGAAGLVVNLAAFRLLHRTGSQSLNLRAAMRHVVADLLGSIGVVGAGLVILLTGFDLADPIASVVIGVLVLASSWTILRDSVGVLLEATPRGIDAEEVGRAMLRHERVVEVHDLHVWTITSGFPSLSAHVLVEPDADCHGIRRELERVLDERFGIDHTTLQVDHAPRGAVQMGTAVRREGPLSGR